MGGVVAGQYSRFAGYEEGPNAAVSLQESEEVWGGPSSTRPMHRMNEIQNTSGHGLNKNCAWSLITASYGCRAAQGSPRSRKEFKALEFK